MIANKLRGTVHSGDLFLLWNPFSILSMIPWLQLLELRWGCLFTTCSINWHNARVSLSHISTSRYEPNSHLMRLNQSTQIAGSNSIQTAFGPSLFWVTHGITNEKFIMLDCWLAVSKVKTAFSDFVWGHVYDHFRHERRRIRLNFVHFNSRSL